MPASPSSGAPQFSVIIAAGTQTNWLGEALSSLQRQTLTSWEARIVIYEEVARNDIEALLSDIDDPRIEIVGECEPGCSPLSRNVGARQARGMYLVFMDEDDLYHPAHLESLERAWETHPECGLIYSQCFFFWEGNELETFIPRAHRGEVDEETVRQWIMIAYYWPIRGTSTLSFRKDRLEKIGGFDEKVFNTDDLDVVYNTVRNYPIASVPVVTVGRRHHFRKRLSRPDRERVLRTSKVLEEKYGFQKGTLAPRRLEVHRHNRLYDWGVSHLCQEALLGRIRKLRETDDWPEIQSVRLGIKWFIMICLGMERFHHLMVRMRGGTMIADYRAYMRQVEPETA
jgi:glycosyltransferase involved in cell wall biosynthesis